MSVKAVSWLQTYFAIKMFPGLKSCLIQKNHYKTKTHTFLNVTKNICNNSQFVRD